MYELSKQNTALVSGGYLQYVTAQWKHEQADIGGKICGTILGTMGLLLFAVEPSCAAFALPVAFAAGGYALGYSMSRLENSDMENDMLYNIVYY